MRALWSHLVILLTLTAGCTTAPPSIESSEAVPITEPLTMLEFSKAPEFTSATLNREVDQGEFFDLASALDGNITFLLLFTSSMCAGCLEHTSLLSTVSREWEQRDNPIQIISIQRYPAYETEKQVEDTYGDENSEFYAPWPVLITNTNATTLNGVSSNFSSVNSAFGNPGTPTMFIIDSNGDLRAKSVIYYLDGQLDRLEEQISDIQATT